MFGASTAVRALAFLVVSILVLVSFCGCQVTVQKTSTPSSAYPVYRTYQPPYGSPAYSGYGTVGTSSTTTYHISPGQLALPGTTISVTNYSLADGKIYSGHLKLHWGGHWYPEGTGQLKLTNGARYEGKFSDGNPVGQGVLYGKDGSRYEGDLKNYVKEGNGTSYSANGCKYEGEWKDDKSSGQGTMTMENGATYQGQWVNGGLESGTFKSPTGSDMQLTLKDGHYVQRGTEVCADGTKFVGSWGYGVASSGTITWKDGRVYKGGWQYTGGDEGISEEDRDFLPNGKGEMTTENGATYQGQWENGTLVNGIFKSPTGSEMKLTSRDGHYIREGTEVCADGTKFTGSWESGATNMGTITWKNGQAYEGGWEYTGKDQDVAQSSQDYLPDGSGEMTWPDGRKYTGDFKDGMVQGKGKMTYPDGKVQDGDWQNNEFSVTPQFTNLSSATTTYGNTSVPLSGTVEATNGSYLPSGTVITVTVDAKSQQTTVKDLTGDFTINYNATGISASITPYPVTYTSAAATKLIPATNRWTTLTVNPLPVVLRGYTVYNGTTTVPAANLKVANLLMGSGDLTLAGGVTVAGTDTGPEAITSFSGLSLGGTAAANYTLAGASGTVTIFENTKQAWKDRLSRICQLFAVTGTKIVMMKADFFKIMGEPDRTQTFGESTYWYYDCSDGTIQVVLNSGDLNMAGLMEGDVNDY